MNKNAVLTAITLGAGLGLASYLMHGSKAADVRVDAIIAAEAPAMQIDIPNAQLAKFLVNQYDKTACRALYGEHYQASGADCVAPVECTSCVTHKGIARNAVIHANTWIRGPKASGPDYDALMRQDKLVFQMSMASQASTEAGRQAYDHVTRCQAIYAGADIQCKQ